MKPSEIAERLVEIEGKLVDKTGERPFISLFLMADQRGAFSIALNRAYHDGDYILGTAKGCSPEEAFAKAEKLIAGLPTSYERGMDDFRKSVAAAIDRGREAGVEVAFLNPLMA